MLYFSDLLRSEFLEEAKIGGGNNKYFERAIAAVDRC